MKRIVMTMLLSLMVMSVSSFTYQTEYNYQRSTFGATSSYIPHNKSQSIEYRGIGYTTNYSNGQFNSTQYYQGTYTQTSSSSVGSRHVGPRKSPQRPDPYNNWRDWWRMNVWDIIGGDSNWPSYVNEDYWVEFMEKYGDTEYGDYARQWWEQNHHGQTPPWAVPIGDNYIWFMVCMVSIYSLIKLKRNKLKHSAY